MQSRVQSQAGFNELVAHTSLSLSPRERGCVRGELPEGRGPGAWGVGDVSHDHPSTLPGRGKIVFLNSHVSVRRQVRTPVALESKTCWCKGCFANTRQRCESRGHSGTTGAGPDPEKFRNSSRFPNSRRSPARLASPRPRETHPAGAAWRGTAALLARVHTPVVKYPLF